MWESIEDRLHENERDRPIPLRRALFDALRGSGLRPGRGITKKMVSFEFGAGERLLWEIQNPANIFLQEKWRDRVEANGFVTETRPYQSGMKDGGRHSALSRDWSFGDADCIVVRIENAQELQQLLAVLLNSDNALVLNAATITRWIEQLRELFPSLDRFDRPDSDFDEKERTYKLETAAALRAGLEAANDDETLVAAVLGALQGSNLLQWRIYWPMSTNGDGDPRRIASALRELVEAADGPADGHPEALQRFAAAWADAVPNPQRDHARQIGEFILMHLAPDTGIYIRHTVREDFWREGFGVKFPAGSSLAETYRNELFFMSAVRDAFLERGLAPRDMIDVQGALWAIHNYTDADTPARPEKSMSDTTPATNLILHGPPGTGKTYLTAAEAVRLCGEQVPEARSELMEIYQRLLAAGRIEFVTFHQSMSYEEFVEGLRPETQGAESQELDADELDSAGFRLKAENGVFKRICERARLDTGDNGGGKRLDRQRNLFKLSLIGSDWQAQLASALAEGKIFWGFGSGVDWSADDFEDFEAIKHRWRESDPDKDPRSADISGTWYFRVAVDVGDYVLLSVGKNRIVALAEIVGDYEHEPGAVREHSRRVRWIWHDQQGAQRSEFYPENFSAFQPMYQLAADRVDWDALEKIALGEAASRASEDARNHVLIIDEINRANISKVFGELITLLEPDKRLRAENEIRLTLPYSKKLFGVPSNLHVIGTMNTADRSIALLDTALRRRFTFREMMPEASVLEGAAEKCGIDLPRLLTTINERIEYLYDREHQIGHAYFTECRSQADVDEVMRHRVIPLLAEYFFEDWAKIAAVLGDLEAHEGPITGGFLKREILNPPPGLEDGDAVARFRWQVRSVDEGFDYSKLVGT
jgi:DNA polymerase III delta prime subunit